ncbi:hypothetical protein [Kineococcus terrestris]|uniref:hypothetical protein n=1 Tax=Kineococcus terrestris TaxID=2044856 RepID=UPI0034DB1759
MAYRAEKPPLAETPEQLRARIPGWGVDLDPADRPAVPRELPPDPTRYGAHWDFPERQPERVPRERSVEHAQLPPVFGTVAPPHGLSGVVRRYAYRWSEGRNTHWLLLMAADRIDAVESAATATATRRGRASGPWQARARAESSGHGLRSRAGRGRADVRHQWLDPLVVGAPWVLGAAAAVAGARALARAGRR